MTQYRYQLEKYRGRSTRHVCPRCGRKGVFTRYIDTENNNIYINDDVGKCDRLDKCGYHYTPHQYFTDNSWKRDKDFTFSIFQKHRDFEKMKIENPPPTGYIPEIVWEQTSPTLFAIRCGVNPSNSGVKPSNTPINGGCGFCGGIVPLQHEKSLCDISPCVC